MNVYKLVNPSDDWSFEAPSHKIAWIVATYVGDGKTPAEFEGWQSPFIFGGKPNPEEAFRKEFGEELKDAVVKYRTEMVAAFRSFIIARKEAPKDMDRKALFKWNDKRRSSMNDFGGYANQIADSIEKVMKQKEGAIP